MSKVGNRGQCLFQVGALVENVIEACQSFPDLLDPRIPWPDSPPGQHQLAGPQKDDAAKQAYGRMGWGLPYAEQLYAPCLVLDDTRAACRAGNGPLELYAHVARACDSGPALPLAGTALLYSLLLILHFPHLGEMAQRSLGTSSRSEEIPVGGMTIT